jgi:hypothetical protein
VKRTSWSQGLTVTADGEGGAAGRVGGGRGYWPTGSARPIAISAALTRRGFLPGHARGQVWVDVATMLTAG